MIRLRKKVQPEEISAASMSDIAFLLLVFFMVTAVFFVKEGLNIQLPKKNSDPVKVHRKDVYEFLVAKDTVKMRNLSVGVKSFTSLDEFRSHLNKIQVDDMPQKVAIIITTGDTPYGKMLDALSAVQLRGFSRISVKKKK